MWPFEKKLSIEESKILVNLTDCHSHILPGVDDGVQTKEESFEILKYYENLGIKKVIFTPHIMVDIPQSLDDLRLRFAALKEEYNAMNAGSATTKVELSLAAEHMLDYKFFEILDAGDMLCLWDNYLLVEMSYLQHSLNIFECVKKIMSRGYFVVLAHPERYLFLYDNDYKKLKSMGVLFQLNFTSLFGAYGDNVKKKALTLLNSSYYNLIGTDLHRIRSLKHLVNDATLSKKQLSMLEVIKENNPIPFV